jgi:hypothetical protein
MLRRTAMGGESPWNYPRGDNVIWQRIGAHRAPAFHGEGGLATRRIRAWRNERGSRVALAPPAVIREPEASWWSIQDELESIQDELNEPTPPAGPTMTIAVLREQEAELDAAVARLAALAVADELLVIFGSTSCPQHGQHAVIAGLRDHLPRHDVVAVHVRHRGADMRLHAATLDQLMDGGSLPVVVTAPAAMHDVTAEISSYVRADRILRVFRTTTGADLFQVWRRRPEPATN